MPVPVDHAHLPFFNPKTHKMVTPTSCMIDFQNMKDNIANGFWQAYKRAHPEIEAKKLNKKHKKVNLLKNIVDKKK